MKYTWNATGFTYWDNWREHLADPEMLPNRLWTSIDYIEYGRREDDFPSPNLY